jgi:outer membrane protein W
MKNKLNTAIAALFVVTASMGVMATEVGGTYVTAGMMKISTDELDELKTISGVSVDDEDTVATLTVGYQFDKNLSFEAGAISEYDVSVTGAIASSSGTLFGKSYSFDAGDLTLKSKFDTGYTLGAKYGAPVNESFDVYGRLGMYFWDTSAVASSTGDVTYDGTTTAAGTEVTIATESGSDVYLGIGSSYKINQSTSINADYLKFDIDGSDVDGLSLAVAFDF